MTEFKSGPQHIKKIEDREVTGIFSVFGVIDSYSDRIWPGAFNKTIAERGARALFLWQHDFGSPPVAVIKSLREIPRDELPPEILAEYPESTGGAEVVREYLDTQRGNEALAAIKAGAPLQMSFGYDAIRYDFEELPNAKYDWERLRNLREVRLWEVSDVLWGANEATVADVSKALAIPLTVLTKQLLTHMEELTKGGARHSATDIKLLNAIHRAAVDLGCTECLGIVEEADDKQAVVQDDEEKCRAGATEPPLTLLTERLMELELSLLTGGLP